MSFYTWKPYIPVAERRRQAAGKVAKLAKKGKVVSPVVIEGRTIARSFWGKSWCKNLESYSDYDNRLPRGRTYVRNGSVIDLKIAGGEVSALVSGSSIYKVKIAIAPASPALWKALCKDCAGSIDSLVELLQGRFSKGVMERVCLPGKGLFPSLGDIKLSCSCSDWASMCKHVAAVLYGVGARLDQSPELLFTLRKVDHGELVSQAGENVALTKKPVSNKRIMESDNLASIFGLEMAASEEEVVRPKALKKRNSTAPASEIKSALKSEATAKSSAHVPGKAPTKTKPADNAVSKGANPSKPAKTLPDKETPLAAKTPRSKKAPLPARKQRQKRNGGRGAT